MNHVKVSVIIPTRNRSERLAETLACLKRQELDDTDYEVIVVDDGSLPPVALPRDLAGEPKFKIVRLEGVERSAARNSGAAAATGDLLVFVDDDMTFGAQFLSHHVQAHTEWPDSLAVGSVQLPDEMLAKPFGAFRQRLEQNEVPRKRGLTPARNFCTAANMSVARKRFEELRGFDCSITSGEDQDLALRHTGRGGRIAFIPEACVIHHDSALDIDSYCQRTQWGALHMITFCKRYPGWPDNIERERINGDVRWGREPLSQSARKTIKLALSSRPVVALFFGLAHLLERIAPRSYALDRVYRLLLGAHILRGYRRGLKRFAAMSVDRKTDTQRSAFIAQD